MRSARGPRRPGVGVWIPPLTGRSSRRQAAAGAARRVPARDGIVTHAARLNADVSPLTGSMNPDLHALLVTGRSRLGGAQPLGAMRLLARSLVVAGLGDVVITASLIAQGTSFTVTLVPPTHGTVRLTPPLPADGRYRAGTVVILTTTPDAGHVLDSACKSAPGRFGQMYHEGMAPEFKVTIDQEKRVGASFIEASLVKDLVVHHDIIYAKPGVKSLKYDVYTPKGARNLPIIVIIHGGGRTANDEDIMRGLARELTQGGRFVVASVDYRWAGNAEGDATGNTMANLIEDVFGGIAHIMEHAADNGADPSRVGVTGDSAGGHLAAVASLMTEMIGSRGFGKLPGVFEFMPSYLPEGQDGWAGSGRTAEGR